VKAWLRATKILRDSGLTTRQAIHGASAEMARAAEIEAAAKRASQPAPPPTEIQRPVPPTPRVRTL
jgi:hypothetical protein